MRRTRTGLLIGAMALVLLAGCANDAHLKPPKPDPEYILPPPDDPRFNTYPRFPEKTLNDFPKKASGPDMPGTPSISPPGRSRLGAGAGGPGGF